MSLLHRREGGVMRAKTKIPAAGMNDACEQFTL